MAACDSTSPFPGGAKCVNKAPGHDNHFAQPDYSDPESPGYESWTSGKVAKRIGAVMNNRTKEERHSGGNGTQGQPGLTSL